MVTGHEILIYSWEGKKLCGNFYKLQLYNFSYTEACTCMEMFTKRKIESLLKSRYFKRQKHKKTCRILPMGNRYRECIIYNPHHNPAFSWIYFGCTKRSQWKQSHGLLGPTLKQHPGKPEPSWVVIWACYFSCLDGWNTKLECSP